MRDRYYSNIFKFDRIDDPGADRILFWDYSEDAGGLLTLGTNLSISGTTLNASGGASVAFKTITGITNDVVADDADDTLTLSSANAALTIVGTSATDTVTFTLVEGQIDHDNLTNTHNLTTDIDHDTITNTHNLTTDIDHDTITNTHNLTTDIDHDQLTNFTANEHFLQTAITNVSTALSTGLLKVTTGTGALSVVTDNSSNWNDAYTHSQIAGGDSVHVSTTENTNWDAAYTHVSSTGTDHSYIDQSVTSTSNPTFRGLLISDDGTILGGTAGSDSRITIAAGSDAGAGNQTSVVIDGDTDSVLVYDASSNSLILTPGSITDSTGAISFDNENISTTGTLSAGTLSAGATTASSLTVSDLTQYSLVIGGASGSVDSLGAATNGQIPIGSTGTNPTLATITGTSNQITVTNGAGSITLSTPQDIDTSADVQFASVTITDSSFQINDGSYSLFNSDTARYSVYAGQASGGPSPAGNYNTSFGHEAGNQQDDGDYNTDLGYRAGYGRTDENNGISIGYMSGAYLTGTDGYVVIDPFNRSSAGGEIISSLIIGYANGTVGNQWMRFNSVTFFGPGTKCDGWVRARATEVQTTDATPTVIALLPIQDENTYHIEARVIGVKSDGSDRASYHVSGTVYRTGGANAVFLGSTMDHQAESDPNWNVGMSVTTTYAYIYVVGKAATTIEWGCSLCYMNNSN